MKRLIATLAVVTALVVPAVATAPASASEIEPIPGVKVACVNQSNPTAAKFTVTYEGKSLSYTVKGISCPSPPF
jgi:hypothetical protein